MAETQPKRQREEEEETLSSNSSPKRHKPYTNILNLLDDEDEPEPTHQDLSTILNTLQQELSSSDSTTDSLTDFDIDSVPSTDPFLSEQVSGGAQEEEEGLESVMRHLLEASDDELGIPNRGGDEDGHSVVDVENFPFAFGENGIWEFEDEAANYYTVLQSELFM